MKNNRILKLLSFLSVYNWCMDYFGLIKFKIVKSIIILYRMIFYELNVFIDHKVSKDDINYSSLILLPKKFNDF